MSCKSFVCAEVSIEFYAGYRPNIIFTTYFAWTAYSTLSTFSEGLLQLTAGSWHNTDH